jgi:hypothetical protein
MLQLALNLTGIGSTVEFVLHCTVSLFALNLTGIGSTVEFVLHCTVSLFAVSSRMRMGCGRALRAFACFVIML